MGSERFVNLLIYFEWKRIASSVRGITIVPIHNDGVKTDCSRPNYRGISLISTT